MSPLDLIPPFEQAVEVFLAAKPSPVVIIDDIVPISFRDPFHQEHTALRLSNALEETNHFLSRFDNVIESLMTLRQLHEQRRASIHNMLSVPLLRLPPEITGMIFEFHVGSVNPSISGDYHRRLYYLAHICSQWRRIALSLPVLYASMDFYWLRQRSQMQDWLSKSGEGPLEIYSAEREDLDTIQAVASRIRFLHYSDHPDDLDIVCQSFERLEGLDLQNFPIADMSDWNLPALRQLALSTNTLEEFSISTSRIRFLSLQQLESDVGLYELLMSLEQLEGLELASITWEAPIEWEDEENPVEWVFKPLQHLRILPSARNSLGSFFHKCTCPNLQTFYYAELSRHALWESLSREVPLDIHHETEAFLRRSPLLHTMTFDLAELSSPRSSPSPFDGISVAVLRDTHTTPLPILPNLRTLRLVGTGGAPQFITYLIQAIRLRHPNHRTRLPLLSHIQIIFPPLPQTSAKPPLRLEIEDPSVLEEYRTWCEEGVLSVEQIFYPGRRSHPE